MAPRKQGPLRKAFEEAILNNHHIEDIDRSVVEAGRAIADAIDKITADPEATPTEKTKALYLTPHLISILRELLATPLARKSAGLSVAEQKPASKLRLIQDAAKKASQITG